MVAFIHISMLPIPSPIRTVTRLYSSTPSLKSSISDFSTPLLNADIPISGGGTSGGSSFSGGGGGGGGNNGKDGSSADDQYNDDPSRHVDVVNLFLHGWRSRIYADPQFLFKLLMEQLVGVSACVLGDMASRPNFGFNELDFVFSTLVVGSILNFVLMYLLAPTAESASFAATSLPSYFFEPGNYSILSRIGSLTYKGAYFAAVGFAAGLAGTAISNGLIALRRKMDPGFELPNKPPPTLLNAGTWAIHMGVSSNLRYQTLNGVEFLMARVLPSTGFKVLVLALRCLNNVVGGMSFVVLARMTGSQKVEGKGKGQAGGYGELQRTEPNLCCEIDCVICLCKIRRAKETAALRCRHLFHKKCLDGWMKKSKGTTCPLCRDSLIDGSSSATKNGEGEDGGLIRSENIIIISPFAESRGRDLCWIR